MKNKPSKEKDIVTIISFNILHFRTRLGLSQEELAARANLDRSYVGRVERGENNVTARNIAKLAAALQVEPYELLIERSTRTEES
jgi:transcriptional regulator with XRE-family HTH domain